MMQELITTREPLRRLTLVTSLLMTGAISAHSTAQTGRLDVSSTAVASTSQSARPGQVVLLREGSTLVQTTGIMRRNAADQWTFVVDAPNARSGQIELILLPCATLEEMERVAATSAGDPRFQTTGEAFVYMNKNYFLATHSPYLLAIESKPTEEVETPADENSDDAAMTETDDTTAADSDSIEDIMQRLEERAGPIARSTAPTTNMTQATSGNGSSANGRSQAREDMMIVDRRGHLTRGSGGAWIFVFDADAEGLADPPAFIMPCLLLERMQQEARKAGNVAPMLITGRMFSYHGRSYLLPTLYRIPTNRTQLVP